MLGGFRATRFDEVATDQSTQIDVHGNGGKNMLGVNQRNRIRSIFYPVAVVVKKLNPTPPIDIIVDIGQLL